MPSIFPTSQFNVIVQVNSLAKVYNVSLTLELSSDEILHYLGKNINSFQIYKILKTKV